MTDRSNLEEYLLEILGRARAARARARRLLAKDFVSSAPTDFARTLERMFGYAERAAVSLFSKIEWTDPDLVESDRKVLRAIDDRIQLWSSLLRYVQGATTDRLPWGLIPSFEKLAEELVPGRQVLLRPKWNYNYTVTPNDFRKAFLTQLEELGDCLPGEDIEKAVLRDLRKPFHVVAFPSLERENILLHTLLGHELGHLLVAGFFNPERRTAFRQSIQEKIHKLTERQVAREGHEGIQPEPLLYTVHLERARVHNTDLAETYWSRALEEILSDLAGALLFGPAALLSTFDMVVRRNPDIAPQDRTSFYPPWRMRLREVLRVVDSQAAGFFPIDRRLFRGEDAANRADVVNRRIERIREFCQVESDQASIDASPIARIAYGAVRGSILEGLNYLLSDQKSRLAKKQATASILYRNLADLIERLDCDLPPNAKESSVGDRTRVDLVEIINAAWLQRASLPSAVLHNGELSEDTLRRRSIADRLTHKAIQCASLAEEFWGAGRRKNSKNARKLATAPETKDQTLGFSSHVSVYRSSRSRSC